MNRYLITKMSTKSKRASSFTRLFSSVASCEGQSQMKTIGLPDPPSVRFSHVHFYVDHVELVETYKELENVVNSDEIRENVNDDLFVSQNRDVIRQLIVGLGFRVTGYHHGDQTRSMLVTSKDSEGVQFVITSVAKPDNDKIASNIDKQEYHHFLKGSIESFFAEHNGRQGVAVLAFQVSQSEGGVDAIRKRYVALHPNLIATENEIFYEDSESKVFEAYAYYKGDKMKEVVADYGTRLRFVERDNSDDLKSPLPGLIPISANFSQKSQAAYCDHWVSNVISRTGFIDTLQDILGFVPKVDFNAGVVAAGEAQIESTVSGNTSPFSTPIKEAALRDQSQIYLPINNALSPVGHVHGFINEIGQGVQHIASRVENLVAFVQQANDNRKRYGEGFTFLNIPRSYYGTLTVDLLQNGINDDIFVSEECAYDIYNACEKCGLIDAVGAVNLDYDVNTTTFPEKLEKLMTKSNFNEEFTRHKLTIFERISLSRYSNLYKLLREELSKDTYLGIVRNKILIDVQGGDLLFQIFTSNILQRKSGEESPFFEFIQRVCSSSSQNEDISCSVDSKLMKPGCGGFGIRNFLTLFLSIEVSKAMHEVKRSKDAEDALGLKFAERTVDIFTRQLNESNPILTEISDAMTAEGVARDRATLAQEQNDSEQIKYWLAEMERASKLKDEGNKKLMQCSSRYMLLMKQLREEKEQ